MTYKRVDGLPEADYHAMSQVGSSTIKAVSVSPAYYQQQKLATREESVALTVGSMFHQRILEPDRDEFIAAPEVDRRTKEGKALYAEFVENAVGKTVLKKSDYDNTLAMVEAFRQTNAYLNMMNGDVATEVSIIGSDRKCRFDVLKRHPNGFYVAYDLKTTDEVPQDEKSWQRYFMKWNYHIQAAWYIEVASRAGIEVKAFHFAVVSKKPPYDHAVVRLDGEFLHAGHLIAEQAFQLYQECNEKNKWPGAYELSGEGSQVIPVPRWL